VILASTEVEWCNGTVQNDGVVRYRVGQQKEDAKQRINYGGVQHAKSKGRVAMLEGCG